MPDARPIEFPPVLVPSASPATALGPYGRLDELAGFLAARGADRPERPRLVVVAGDHGVAAAGVSARQPGATAAAVAAIRAGGGVAVLADAAGAGVLVADVAVDAPPTDGAPHRVRAGSGRIDREDALSAAEVDAAVRIGRGLADAEVDAGTALLLAGHLGAGATTAAGVVVAALIGAEPVAVVGRGSLIDGRRVDDAGWMRRIAAVRDALRRARPAGKDPVALLRVAGGADLAALAGFLAQAAVRQVPVLLDGAVTLAAALAADALAPGSRAWWLAAQADPEPVARLACEHLGLTALLDLGVTVGDGSGALAALPLVRIAGALRDVDPDR